MYQVDQSYAQSHTTPLFIFFFNDTATTEIYTLSLHDALPISGYRRRCDAAPSLAYPQRREREFACLGGHFSGGAARGDRKSTRLNSSHANISYAVFCLKKKTKHIDAYYYLSAVPQSPHACDSS